MPTAARAACSTGCSRPKASIGSRALTAMMASPARAQVAAKERRQAYTAVLHRPRPLAIDKAAMKAGRGACGDYIEDGRREGHECSDDLESEATAEAARLEEAYTRDVLARLVAAG